MRRETPLEGLLLQSGEFADCVLIHHEDGVGALVAYVVPGNDQRWEVTETVIATLAPAIDGFVRLRSLPVTAQGEIDLSSVDHLVLIDRLPRDRLERALRAAGTEGEVRITASTPHSIAPALPDDSRTEPTTPGAALNTGGGRPAVDQRSGGPSVLSGPPLSRSRAIPRAFADALHEAADRGAGGCAFLQPDGDHRELSYGQLEERAAAVAERLQVSLPQGVPVVLQVEDRLDYLVSIWACLLGGFPVVPLESDAIVLDVDRLKAVVRTFDACAVLVQDSDMAADRGRLGAAAVGARWMATTLGQVEPLDGPDNHRWGALDVAPLMMPTSGSTGRPKLVKLSAENALTMCEVHRQVFGLEARDVSFNWLSLEHVGGLLMSHLRDVWIGARQLHTTPDRVLRNPTTWLDLLDEHRAVASWAPNFAFRLIVENLPSTTRRWDLSCVRVLLNAGEMVIRDTVNAFAEALSQHGLRRDAIRPVWGMSETSSGSIHGAATALHTDRLMLPVGRPMPSMSARVVDERGSTVEQGTVGELEVAGPMVTTGYVAGDTIAPPAFSVDGWLRTGDLAVIEAAEVTIVGRKKEVVIVNGRNTSCAEIENIVDRACPVLTSYTTAFSVRDRSGIERLAVAYVPLASAGDTAVVDQLIRSAVGRRLHCRVDHVVPVAPSDVPKTSIGKIQRAELARRLVAAGRISLDNNTATVTDGVVSSFPAFERSWVETRPRRPERRASLRRLQFLRHGRMGSTAETIADRVPAGSADADVAVFSFDADHAMGEEELIWELASSWRKLFAAKGQKAFALLVVGVATGVAAPQTGLLGTAVRCLTREHPHLHVRFILAERVERPERLLELLLIEADELAFAPEVRYVGARRLVQRIRRTTLCGGNTTIQRLVVTGGLGGIGREVVKMLVGRRNCEVLLLGRRPAHSVAKDVAELGVEYAEVSLDDGRGIEAALGQFENSHGPLDTVLHLAGHFEPATVAEFSYAQLHAALTPKLSGARSLAAVVRARPGCRYIGFSSATSFLGGAAIVTHAVASRATEVVVEELAAEGLPALAIAWAAWTAVGASAREHFGGAARAGGYLELDPGLALEILAHILERDIRGTIAIGLDASRQAVARELSTSAAIPIDELVLDTHNLDELPEIGPILDRRGRLVPWRISGRDRRAPRATPVGPETGDDLGRLRRVWCDVLRVPSTSDQDDFFALGGDSVAAATLQTKMEEEFGVCIALRDILQNATVDGLARFLTTPA